MGKNKRHHNVIIISVLWMLFGGAASLLECQMFLVLYDIDCLYFFLQFMLVSTHVYNRSEGQDELNAKREGPDHVGNLRNDVRLNCCRIVLSKSLNLRSVSRVLTFLQVNLKISFIETFILYLI